LLASISLLLSCTIQQDYFAGGDLGNAAKSVSELKAAHLHFE
jgi:hypothetical protein